MQLFSQPNFPSQKPWKGVKTKPNPTKVKESQYVESNEYELMKKEFTVFYDEILMDLKDKMDVNYLEIKDFKFPSNMTSSRHVKK